MDHAFARASGSALLGLLTAALLSAPVHARVECADPDRHEIPAFVLERTELVPDLAGTDARLPERAPEAPAV
jgi:hypothetical protein